MSQNETIDDSSSDIRYVASVESSQEGAPYRCYVLLIKFEFLPPSLLPRFGIDVSSYEPSSAWESNGNLGIYGPYNGTVRSTAQEGASVTFTFRGTSVSLSCLVWPTGANLTATLDSVSLGTFDTSVSSSSEASVKVIFTKDGLDGSADHVLVIAKAANDPGWQSAIAGDPYSHVNIDSFTVAGFSSSGDSSNSPSSSSSSSKPPIGAIVGGVVGGVVILLLVIGLLIWRRRRNAPHGLVHATPGEASIQPDGSRGRVLDINGDRREKVIVPELDSPSHEPTGGRWRSSLFQLPGHRVLNANTRYEEGRDATPLQRLPSASASSLRNGSPPPRSLPATHQGTLLSTGTANTNAQQPSSIERGDAGTHSSAPPSTVITSVSSPAPISTPAPSNEKSTPREESGTGSLPSATETGSFSASAVDPRATTSSGLPMTAALLQELAGLREQVRHLTEIQHRNLLGGSVYSDGNDPHEPPPEYVGRDSDERSRV
ncbi:hypothetical protein FRB91_000610 [Serendipita sp. 411]|nr:hypothetical protein FRB91_000610 [Serendipita sp. 411]